MKRVIFLLCAFISLCTFAWDEKPKCGLEMQIVDVEGPAMPGCYQVIHIKVSNPTDTVAYVPHNSFLGTWQMNYIEETAYQYYINTGYYWEDLRLNPGEEKNISINAQIFKSTEGYVQIVAIGDGGSSMTYVDEYFCNMAVDVIPYEEWDMTTDITIEGLEKVDGKDILPTHEVSALLSWTNNQSEVFTPISYNVELTGYYTNVREIEEMHHLNYPYILPNDTYEERVSFNGLKEGKAYCLSLYNRISMIPWDSQLLYETEPFVVNTTLGINSVCDAGSDTDGIYNLNGIRLSKEPERGIFIKNGKKIVR